MVGDLLQRHSGSNLIDIKNVFHQIKVKNPCSGVKRQDSKTKFCKTANLYNELAGRGGVVVVSTFG